MAKMVLENIIPVFISVFIVQWSDRFGRKPLLLSSVFGKRTPIHINLYKKMINKESVH